LGRRGGRLVEGRDVFPKSGLMWKNKGKRARRLKKERETG